MGELLENIPETRLVDKMSTILQGEWYLSHTLIHHLSITCRYMVQKTLLSTISEKDSDLEMLVIQLFQTRKAKICT